MPIDPDSSIAITTFGWVPDFARGFVRDLRPRWACEEAGIGYAVRTIDVMNKPEEYAALQPFGQVPVLHDGPLHIFETGAILLHLGEKSEALLPPGGQARADTIAWLFAALNSVEPYAFEATQVNGFAREEEWARLRWPGLQERIATRLTLLDTALGDREWIAGSFSIADIALVTVLRELDGHGLVSAHARLADYLARGIARPDFGAALDAQLALIDGSAPPPKEI